LSLVAAWDVYFGQLAAQDRYIVVERQTYLSGRPKPDVISVKEANGDDFTGDWGARWRLQLPPEVFAYFLSHGMIAEDARERRPNRSIYRLTPDALPVAQQLGWLPPLPPGTNNLHFVLLACQQVLAKAA
jgi:hypothetical protein